MENNPLVTVNILSYNRKDELRNTLLKVYEQNYKNIEVIVVDNASDDGTSEMVRNDFPDVNLINMKKNIGITGWNEGFKRAKGEYVMVLDDDSYPTTGVIENGINEFQYDRKLGAVTFNVHNTRTNSSETKDFMRYPYFFHGCGTLFKKRAVDAVGYFNEMIFIYYHELDYSARIYNAGYNILYLAGYSIIHNQSMLGRDFREKESDPFKSEYRYSHYFISYSIILLQRFYWYYSLVYLIKWILNRLIICVTNNYYRAFIKSVIFLIKNVMNILKGRMVLNKEVQKFYRNGNEVLIDRNYFPNYHKPKLFR